MASSSSSSSARDNWERLVAAVVKREEIWQLCHQDSISIATTSSHRPSNSSAEILSISSNRSKRISVSPPRQRPHTGGSSLEEDLHLHLGQVRRFSLHEVQFATENFHNKNIIARGVKSRIYKGRLADGSLVAFKRLMSELQEIGTELEITSIAAHRNVLRVCGFCITEKERLLVYPFMVNGSVASQLRERHESLPPLNWPVRERIALGAAKGLAYLHYECLRKAIHRDVKAANVLLDEDFEAVVADFNLAEFMDCYDGDVTSVKGTLGHIAPEYLATGTYTEKVDVFGYGVFLLELITAQKSYDLDRAANNDDMMLLNRVKQSYKDRKWKMMVDADLEGDFVDAEVEKLLQLALICTQTDPERRPTMSEVVRMLEVGYGLAKRWEELYTWDFKLENMELGHLRRFTIHELQAATEDFSNKIVSRDGFNMIYKGWIDGSPIAIKRYNSQSLAYCFEKELDIGRNCVHPNLVHVIGVCQTTEERLLVFRLMVNGSVESWLKGRHESRPPLTWKVRMKIALGVARGLAYLHDRCGKKIIHHNVKASNILLDENFEAVVADFELAEFMNWNVTRISTAVVGTVGHIAPEFLATGECSDKTDVYSYGVFLLELITGQEAFHLLRRFKFEDMLIDWVKRNYEERKWEVMVDEDDGGDFMEDVVKQLVQIALLCTRLAPYERPKMSDVVQILLGDSDSDSDGDGDGDGGYGSSSDLAPEELSGPR